MEQQLANGLGEGQIAEFIEQHDVEAAEIVGHASLLASLGLAFQLVDKINHIEEASAQPSPDAGAGDGNSQMGLARARAADQHGIALVGNKGAIGQIPDQGLVDGGALEVPVQRGGGCKFRGLGLADADLRAKPYRRRVWSCPSGRAVMSEFIGPA
jgi:hypothetical protein